MVKYLHHHNANRHWSYPTSEETDAGIDRSRAAFADFLGSAPGEVVFGPNMTTLTFHLSRALGRGWGPGDEIVVTELDHHANIDPWRALAKERGVTIRTIPFDPETGHHVQGALENALSSRTRLLAIGAASNALGTITDVNRACALAREAGALSFVDAVHYASHRLVDVRAIGCDFLACSPYKFHGPHLGVLFGKGALLEALDAPKLAPALDGAPDRLETGTANHEGIVGAAAAVDFLASLSAAEEGATPGPTRRDRLEQTFHELERRGEAQVEMLWEGLQEIPGVRLFGPPPGSERTSTVSFTLAGHPAVAVSRYLAERGFFLSHGNFYAMTVVERLGLSGEGLVRIGCAAYTTDEEVRSLVQAVARFAGE
jgi:cysteine desulfurase family protein (TIGR01976 family)